MTGRLHCPSCYAPWTDDGHGCLACGRTDGPVRLFAEGEIRKTLLRLLHDTQPFSEIATPTTGRAVDFGWDNALERVAGELGIDITKGDP